MIYDSTFLISCVSFHLGTCSFYLKIILFLVSNLVLLQGHLIFSVSY